MAFVPDKRCAGILDFNVRMTCIRNDPSALCETSESDAKLEKVLEGWDG
jgi:hypothetical protein